MKRHHLDLPPRRGMNDAETAAYIGRSPTWFAEHLPELEAAGFPKKLPLIGTRDRKAVDAGSTRKAGSDAATRDWTILDEGGNQWASLG